MPASSQQHPVGVQGHQAMIESPQTEDTLVSQNDGQLKVRG